MFAAYVTDAFTDRWRRTRYLEIVGEADAFDRLVFPAPDAAPEGLLPWLDGRRLVWEALVEAVARGFAATPPDRTVGGIARQQVLHLRMRGWLEVGDEPPADGEPPDRLAPLRDALREAKPEESCRWRVDALGLEVVLEWPSGHQPAPVVLRPRPLAAAPAAMAWFERPFAESATTPWPSARATSTIGRRGPPGRSSRRWSGWSATIRRVPRHSGRTPSRRTRAPKAPPARIERRSSLRYWARLHCGGGTLLHFRPAEAELCYVILRECDSGKRCLAQGASRAHSRNGACRDRRNVACLWRGTA